MQNGDKYKASAIIFKIYTEIWVGRGGVRRYKGGLTPLLCSGYLTRCHWIMSYMTGFKFTHGLGRSQDYFPFICSEFKKHIMLKLKTAVTKTIFLLFHDVVGMGSPLFFVPPYISGESSFQGNTTKKLLEVRAAKESIHLKINFLFI